MAGMRSLSSSMRSMRMSLTHGANHSNVRASSCAASTQVTGVTERSLKYTPAWDRIRALQARGR